MFDITSNDTALVITDPQNDFLSPEGVTWGLVGENVTENNTVENIEALFKAAKQAELNVFISPHYSTCSIARTRLAQMALKDRVLIGWSAISRTSRTA